MKKTDQRFYTSFLEKYGGLYLYDIDMNKRYKIDHEYICFVNKYGYVLIGNPDHTDGTSTDHGYFLICDELIERILPNGTEY